MPQPCKVPGCNNKASNFRMHVLPKDPVIRSIWCNRMGTVQLQSIQEGKLNNCRVCDFHFDVHTRHRPGNKLKRTALPTLNLPCYNGPSNIFTCLYIGEKSVLHDQKILVPETSTGGNDQIELQCMGDNAHGANIVEDDIMFAALKVTSNIPSCSNEDVLNNIVNVMDISAVDKNECQKQTETIIESPSTRKRVDDSLGVTSEKEYEAMDEENTCQKKIDIGTIDLELYKNKSQIEETVQNYLDVIQECVVMDHVEEKNPSSYQEETNTVEIIDEELNRKNSNVDDVVNNVLNLNEECEPMDVVAEDNGKNCQEQADVETLQLQLNTDNNSVDEIAKNICTVDAVSEAPLESIDEVLFSNLPSNFDLFDFDQSACRDNNLFETISSNPDIEIMDTCDIEVDANMQQSGLLMNQEKSDLFHIVKEINCDEITIDKSAPKLTNMIATPTVLEGAKESTFLMNELDANKVSVENSTGCNSANNFHDYLITPKKPALSMEETKTSVASADTPTETEPTSISENNFHNYYKKINTPPNIVEKIDLSDDEKTDHVYAKTKKKAKKMPITMYMQPKIKKHEKQKFIVNFPKFKAAFQSKLHGEPTNKSALDQSNNFEASTSVDVKRDKVALTKPVLQALQVDFKSTETCKQTQTTNSSEIKEYSKPSRKKPEQGSKQYLQKFMEEKLRLMETKQLWLAENVIHQILYKGQLQELTPLHTIMVENEPPKDVEVPQNMLVMKRVKNHWSMIKYETKDKT